MRLQLLQNPLKELSHEAGSFGERNGDEHLEVFKTFIAPYFLYITFRFFRGVAKKVATLYVNRATLLRIFLEDIL